MNVPENLTVNQSRYYNVDQFVSALNPTNRSFSVLSLNIAGIRNNFSQFEILVKDIQSKNVVQERNSTQDDYPSNDSQNTDCDDESGWSVYHRKRRNYENRNNVKTENPRSLIIGSKKITGNSLKGIAKTVDVFIGRLDISSTPDEINKYIQSTFDVKVINTEKLSINNNTYNCFKVNIQIQDREKLFDSNMWPQGVIVNKFYLRKSKINK